MDQASIERDLEERPVRELYEEAAQQPWTAPADRRLTEEHIADFVKVATLGNKIVEIAGTRFEKQLDQASRDADRFTRMGNAFSALGNARAAITGHLRAALILKVNPYQHQWVSEQIVEGRRLLQYRRPYDKEIANAKRALGEETNYYLREQKQAVLTRAEESLKHFEQSYGDTELANMRLVEKHAAELSKFLPYFQPR